MYVIIHKAQTIVDFILNIWILQYSLRDLLYFNNFIYISNILNFRTTLYYNIIYNSRPPISYSAVTFTSWERICKKKEQT
jgi:hypothetical protein